jgi:hypothetical protein
VGVPMPKTVCSWPEISQTRLVPVPRNLAIWYLASSLAHVWCDQYATNEQF